METRLDEVEEGRAEWVGLLRNFYDPFAETLKVAAVEMESLKPAPVETEYHCPNTGNVMLLRQGRFGPFLGCSGFPKCRKILKLNAEGEPVEGANFTCGLLTKEESTAQDGARNGTEGDVIANTADLPNATDHVCPEGRGRMLQRQSRYGPFLGCSEYPKCRTSLKINPDGSLKEGQEFVCTYSASAGRNGGKKSGGTARSTAKAAGARKPARRKTAAVAEE
jgi:DNA topoisomerase-1